MVVVAFLHRALFGLKSQHLGAVFAHAAIHVVVTVKDFSGPFCKSRQHLRVIVQISRLDEFDPRVGRGDLIGVMNPQTHSVVEGIVISPTRVAVRIQGNTITALN